MAKKSKTIFKIVKRNRGKVLHTYHKYKSKHWALLKFNKYKVERQVFYKKKTIVLPTGKKKYNRDIALISKTEGERSWKLIEKFQYDEEESFYLYGLKQRMKAFEIFKEIINPMMYSTNAFVMNHHRIVIKSDKIEEVILTKTIKECMRLYNFIFDYVVKQKGTILFLGTADRDERREMRAELMEFTGLKEGELFRTSSRS